MDIFRQEKLDSLPPSCEWDHEINLLPEAPQAIKTKTYPLNPLDQAALDEFIDENMKSGRIRPSKSPYAALVFFIGKNDLPMEKRLLEDYQKLNEVMVKDQYPLP